MKKTFVVLLVLVMAVLLLPAPVARAAEYTAYEARDPNWPSGVPQIGNPISAAIFGLNAEKNDWERITITHFYVKSVGADTATCTFAGGIVCTATGVYEGHTLSVSHTYATPAKGHDIVHHEAQEPTCTEVGWDAYDTCSRCDYTTYAAKPAKGHTVVTDKGKAATCTKAGLTAGKHCSVCGQVLKKQKKVSAKGHLYQSWEPAEEGKHQSSCARCGHGTVGDCVVVAVPQADPNAAAVTLCPVCGHREGGDLVPVTDARAKGGTGDPAVFMTEGEEERLLTVSFQRNGKLQQPKGTVTLTLPAAVVEGYDLFLIGADGAESPIETKVGKNSVTFTLSFTGGGPVCFLRLRPKA